MRDRLEVDNFIKMWSAEYKLSLQDFYRIASNFSLKKLKQII